MACVPAPACRAARKEASELWPGRSQASDGICPSPEHTATNPDSDHERGEAVDITHNPGSGADCHVMVARIVARRDPRVKYLIWNRQIWRSYRTRSTQPPGWTPERYRGDNPHTKHLHISIKPEARNDIGPWFAPVDAAPEDDMADPQVLDRLARMEAMLNRVHYETATGDGNLAKVVGYARIAATRQTSNNVDVKALADALRADLGQAVAQDLAHELARRLTS